MQTTCTDCHHFQRTLTTIAPGFHTTVVYFSVHSSSAMHKLFLGEAQMDGDSL
jgi:hypothetical protein